MTIHSKYLLQKTILTQLQTPFWGVQANPGLTTVVSDQTTPGFLSIPTGDSPLSFQLSSSVVTAGVFALWDLQPSWPPMCLIVTHLFVLSLPSPCPFCIKFPSFLSFLFSCSSILYFSIPILKIQNLSRVQFSALGSPSWLRLEKNTELHGLILSVVCEHSITWAFTLVRRGSLHAYFLLCPYFISSQMLCSSCLSSQWELPLSV